MTERSPSVELRFLTSMGVAYFDVLTIKQVAKGCDSITDLIAKLEALDADDE